ncbi:Delta(3,5)-Delta(2,4)-dienoyl-CoA isomerase [Fusarium oxysporum f. sp. albedinis]|nr:Delta(3,5)-Delta(2,4)-dienoyl-CoA isomerase [Fusarium oxysporum f. sp. albedinis]
MLYPHWLFNVSQPRVNRRVKERNRFRFSSDALKSSLLEILPGTFAKFGYTVVEVLRSDKRVLGSVEVRGLMVGSEDMTMLICSSSSTGVSHLPAQHGQPGLFALELELVETPDSLHHTTWAPCTP